MSVPYGILQPATGHWTNIGKKAEWSGKTGAMLWMQMHMFDEFQVFRLEGDWQTPNLHHQHPLHQLDERVQTPAWHKDPQRVLMEVAFLNELSMQTASITQALNESIRNVLNFHDLHGPHQDDDA